MIFLKQSFANKSHFGTEAHTSFIVFTKFLKINNVYASKESHAFVELKIKIYNGEE